MIQNVTEGAVKNKSLSKILTMHRLYWKRMQEIIHSLPFQFIFFCFESMPDAVSEFDLQNLKASYSELQDAE